MLDISQTRASQKVATIFSKLELCGCPHQAVANTNLDSRASKSNEKYVWTGIIVHGRLIHWQDEVDLVEDFGPIEGKEAKLPVVFPYAAAIGFISNQLAKECTM